MSAIKHHRILLKLSGEALMGESDYGIDPKVIGRLAREIIEVRNAGVQVGVVIGGGNIFRGAGLAASGMDRVTGDHMGMLATVINALAMQDAIERAGGSARTMSAIKINEVCEDFIRRRAIRKSIGSDSIDPGVTGNLWVMNGHRTRRRAKVDRSKNACESQRRDLRVCFGRK